MPQGFHADGSSAQVQQVTHQNEGGTPHLRKQ